MTGRLFALCGLLVLLITPGCGNKGPLYLPDADDAQATEKTRQQ
jgi:predicted small lipoprotein YifL